MTDSNSIRKQFLEYFREHGHAIVPGSPLIPANDPTLLFTNAGMVQFKDVFLGQDQRSYKRAATAQCCVRAGGKHNDLENVGYTARHHTFFEMLGNFSFGDYFKREAIHYAWDFLTDRLGLPPERLWITVYQDDDEAAAIWLKEVGIDKNRFSHCGEKDNFWSMGDTGPCGPCTEIFYDHGAEIPGGPPGSADADADRYVEIWNLVFMQYDRDATGKLTPLPNPSVDTGMGLERIAAVMQGVHSNYEIDLFQDLIRAAARETGQRQLKNPSLNVIADHIRACSFLIVDGVIPGNDGRGYVLRRIIRRAIRHGYKLGQKQPFFHKLVPDLDRLMGDAYPNLRTSAQRVADVLRQEEERFGETLVEGMKRFETSSKIETRAISYVRSHLIRDFKSFESQVEVGTKFRFDGVFHRASEDIVIEVTRKQSLRDVEKIASQMKAAIAVYSTRAAMRIRAYVIIVGKDESTPEELIDITRPNVEGVENNSFIFLYRSESSVPLDGRDAFHLYDTFGFPLDLTQDLCRELGISVDVAGFDMAMEEQRERARSASRFVSVTGLEYAGVKTDFRGYETLNAQGKVVALYREGVKIDTLNSDESGTVVLDRSPFYAESGGQVGDRGELIGASGTFKVNDTQKIQTDVIGHQGVLKTGTLKLGDTVEAKVDIARRQSTMRNHSVTHLMHKALHEVLGPHVQQKGSLVDADKTRFDFSHDQPMTEDEIRQVEQRVNAEIMQNTPNRAQVMPIEEAKKSGAMMLFGEKYGDEVRVLDIGSSREFCGGTHVTRTGDIGIFKIYSEGGVAAGIRRVEATTGGNALAMIDNLLGEFHLVTRHLRAQPGAGHVEKAVLSLIEEKKTLEKEISRLRSKLASGQGADLAGQAVDVKGARVLAATVEGADAKTLRDTADQLKNKLGSAVLVLATVKDDKVSLIASVTKDCTDRIKAGELVNFVAQQVGGKGGGRPDMAQAGGDNPAALPTALASVTDWVRERL